MRRDVQRLTATVAGWFLHADGDAASAPSTAGLSESWAPPRAASPAGVGRRAGGSLALLASGRGARGHGAALALAAAGRGIAIVAEWGVGGAESLVAVPAVPAARRVAGSLRARDVRARACGRLVSVALPDEEPGALEAVRRVEAAGAGAACLLVLAAPRGAGWDPVLGACDEVLVADDDAELVELAVMTLRATGARASALSRRPPAPIRALAAAGLALPGTLTGLRADLAAARR